ncbi:acetyltransferase [Polynucleobacter sp. AP-Kaivos-20-H2]|uniref:acetyltransferase n=1 Tax=Polynucleobacter sp. AP-Kaivos-20-H2 TaxID=2689104 RepID=UPI001C0BF765|nr:acetyltransferase [Polynucleobacter sp. AP-Kaivos-20-H2]MBU3604136.1 acetyltransferase [Polynucleobacter sp. AP-Kaivos-20-H2]
MVDKSNLILVGAGGHARSCVDVIEDEDRFQIAGVVTDEQDDSVDKIFGYSKIGQDSDLLDLKGRYDFAFIVVGQIHSPNPRKLLFSKILSIGFKAPVIISSRAYVSKRAKVGEGTIVMHGAVINSGVEIGRNCIINSMALIEHDTTIGDHCHISTGVRLNGGINIGSDTFIASGAVVKHGVRIGSNCFIGMGSLVTQDLADDTKFLAGH